jgi:hypothetical protein
VHLLIQEYYLETENGKGFNREGRISRNQGRNTKRRGGNLMKRLSQKRLHRKIVKKSKRVQIWKGDYGS